MSKSRMNGNWNDIEKNISNHVEKDIHFKKINSLAGGCINETSKATDSMNNQWFIKINKPSKLDMFIAECDGLTAINNTHSIRTPKVICYGKNKAISYLVLEYIPISTKKNQPLSGTQLAKMHLYKNSPIKPKTQKNFGWHRNNTIGTTPQSNKAHDNWLSFWKDERLIFQLNLAKEKGFPLKDFDRGLILAEKLDTFFNDYTPQPSLLHGDLWSGNCATDENANPIIFDPAVYIGDRETDIAMSELFGGFSQDFYAAYNAHYPLDNGYKTRKQLYNLYHILNHYNLFGEGYASQAGHMIHRLLAET